jgi:hypothetical protein
MQKCKGPPFGTGAAIFDRGGLPSISVCVAVAWWFSLPALLARKRWHSSDGLIRCSSCGYKTSVIAGTIFKGTRKPLVLWFRAIWWVTSQKNGSSARGIQGVLGHSIRYEFCDGLKESQKGGEISSSRCFEKDPGKRIR